MISSSQRPLPDNTRHSLTTDKYPCSRWDSNPRSQQASGRAAGLLRSWVRIPPGAWIFVCCECRVLSGRGLCDEVITRPEESYRLCCVVVCDLETSRMGAPYIYDISRLSFKHVNYFLFYLTFSSVTRQYLSQQYPIHTFTSYLRKTDFSNIFHAR